MIPIETRRRQPARIRGGFTLVELLVVIVILAILIGLLLPAINGALRTARKAAVSAEINQLASALAAFKSKYGDYPPSRFLCIESGAYSQAILGDTTSLNGGTFTDPSSPGNGDITLGQLAQRSVAAIRKFWPRVSTTAAPTGQFYDFNGNGIQDSNAYVLHGHECLVFFLGGIPTPNQIPTTAVPNPIPTAFGMSGFDKNPVNPFTNNISSDPNHNGAANPNYGPNRQAPMFEFVPSRLLLDPEGTSGIPGYFDSLGSSTIGTSGLNFYCYFSAYGNGGYDPNDVNWYSSSSAAAYHEMDANSSGPIGLHFNVAFPNYSTGNISASYAPNPYTSTSSITSAGSANAPANSAVVFINAQTFQIISSGIDGLYGVGGQYVASSTASSTATTAVPVDTVDASVYINTSATNDASVRQREADNLTNFKGGSLQ